VESSRLNFSVSVSFFFSYSLKGRGGKPVLALPVRGEKLVLLS
jgi:hypothetical protein